MKDFLDILLKDQTTGKNILWANDEHDKQARIQIADVYSIRPRHEKNREDQKLRTKTRAEIFTPPEVCKQQNDLVCDAWIRGVIVPWLAEKNYNEPLIVETLTKKISDAWFRHNKISTTEPEPVKDTFVANFLNEHETLWHKFIDAKFLEITCGEAPYIVSRYNVVTGDSIPLAERVGLLDRKFHVIREYNQPVGQWCPLAIRAVQSCYGYEFQGDNLFLARRNVFDTVIEYFTAKFPDKPPEDFLIAVAEIISWNFWQMDGLTNSTPDTKSPRVCRIKDWTTGKPFMFMEIFGM